jgi:hypothetical protein
VTDLSAVVVTYNSAGVIEDCLRSLQLSAGIGGIQLTVVDNASSDETVTKVRQVAPDAHLIANPSNRGLAAANNQGLASARGDLVLICNPDVEFDPGAVAAMVDVMQRRPRAAWVVPRLSYEDGTTQTSAGDLPSLSEALLGRQVARRRSANDRGFWWDDWPHDEERQVGRGHEAAYLVRRTAIDEIGDQDERYFLDWEGLDWTDRFRKAGWEIWFTPQARVLHRGGDSIRRAPLRWAVSQHRGMYLYFADRRPRHWKPLLAAAFAARALIKIAAIGLKVPLYAQAYRAGRSRRS